VSDFIDAKTALLVALGIVATAYVVVLALGLRRRVAANAAEPGTPTAGGVATGFVTNFFDTLGIGSFATTTSIFRFTKMVPDEQIPGTLNVGHALPTIVQALIFTKAVPVDARTLIILIAAAVAGSWLGAGFVVSWSRRSVQLGMGIALVAAASLMLLSMFGLTPTGGDAIGLSGGTLLFAAAMNFGLGALMTLGIGLYAPCMILVSLLGMNPTTAFPIMMGSCAFLMPVASARFIRENGFNPRAALGLLIGGIPAVLIAAFIVKSLPLTVVRWLVVVVVLYTAFGLLRTAMRERAAAQSGAGNR
jgi:uncharacterized membrane protein YfcA